MKRFSKSKNWLIAAFSMILCSTGVMAAGDLQAPFIKSGETPSVHDYFAQAKSDGMVFNQANDKADPVPSFDVRGKRDEATLQAQKKSVQKAFLYSLILPGAGQYYNGSKIKTLLFLGFEAASWASHFSYQGKGDDKTTLFEAFANDHWVEQRYGDYLEMNWGVRDDDSVYKTQGDTTSGFLFTHHLPDSRTQQYFEMIGKYDQFVFGWDDVVPLVSPDTTAHKDRVSDRRNTYEDMRYEANKFYSRATTSLIVMMGNHLISALEAAYSANKHNKNVEAYVQRVKIRAIMAETERDRFPMLTVTYKF